MLDQLYRELRTRVTASLGGSRGSDVDEFDGRLVEILRDEKLGNDFSALRDRLIQS